MDLSRVREFLSGFIPRNPKAILGVFRSLKHRNFALYFYGMAVSLTGAWIQQVAMGWLVFRLTNSAYMLSLAVFLSQIPTLLFSPFTGFISDRFSRKLILILSQLALMSGCMVLFLMCYFETVSIEAVFILSFFFGLIISVEAPARQSFYAELVPPEDLSNAIALNSTVINGTRFIGPAVGGFVIAKWGETWCFFINAVSFLGILISLFLIKSEYLKKRNITTSIFADIIDGFSYVGKSVPIRSMILYLMIFSFFAVPFPLLMPAFVGNVLQGNSQTLGTIMSCVGIGSLGASLFLAARKKVEGLGRVVMASGAIIGFALIAYTLTKNVWIVYLISIPFGFALIALAASINTMLQSMVDDEKRGRVMSLFTMAFFGIPPLGVIVQGYLSKIIELRYVTFSCGLICLFAAGVFEYFRPVLRKYVRKIYAQKGIIMPEIAKGLQLSGRQNFPKS